MKGIVFQRGKTWTYKVDVGKKPETGKRQQITKGGFNSEAEAEKALRKVLYLIDEGEFIKPCKETFADYINRWFKDHSKRRVKETVASDRDYMLNKHLIRENPFANKELSKIKTLDIDSFYNLKLDDGYSTSYIRKMHQMLNQAFDKAVKWELIKENPVLNAEPPSVKYEEMKIWSFYEIDAFLKECKEERNALTFNMALYTGMRKGEILGLTWDNVDFGKKVIYVNKTLNFTQEKGYFLSRVKTTNSKRQIPISEELICMLKSQKQWQSEWKERLGDQYEDKNLVISTEYGKPQDGHNLLRVMYRLIEKAGVTDIRFHDLRHVHASILLGNNVDIVKVSKRLGHANPRITYQYYAHLVPDTNDEVAEIFADVLKNNLGSKNVNK